MQSFKPHPNEESMRELEDAVRTGQVKTAPRRSLSKRAMRKVIGISARQWKKYERTERRMRRIQLFQMDPDTIVAASHWAEAVSFAQTCVGVKVEGGSGQPINKDAFRMKTQIERGPRHWTPHGMACTVRVVARTLSQQLELDIKAKTKYPALFNFPGDEIEAVA